MFEKALHAIGWKSLPAGARWNTGHRVNTNKKTNSSTSHLELISELKLCVLLQNSVTVVTDWLVYIYISRPS